MWRVLTALTIAVSALVHAAEKPADLVLRHGVVLTVDAKDRVAQALAHHRRAVQGTLPAMISQMHAEGMTGVKDPHADSREWAAYLDFASTEGLSIHAATWEFAA
jgi:hypothetical protein